MLPRALEVLLIILLVVITLGVAFQYRNHQLLSDILTELRDRPQRVTLSDDGAGVSLQPKSNPSESGDPVAKANTPSTAVVPTPSSTPEPKENITPEKAASDSESKPEPAKPEPQPEPKPTPEPKPEPAPEPDATETEADPAWEQFGPTITKFTQQLLAGEYDTVVGRFNNHMKSNLPKEQLAAVMDPIRKEHGQFKQITSHKLDRTIPPNMHVFKVGVELADDHVLDLTITVDQQNRIAGLMMK